jgi:beta-galactosidase
LDKELHLKRLRIIKSYGFNHVRHHSTIMPPEYYDACDEIGMISTAEFPICYFLFLPGVGSKWKEMVAPGTDPAAATDTYRREWTAVVRQFRNHPSIMCWVMGNELGQYDALEKPRALFADIAKQYDPQRFFIDSDGVANSVLQDPKNDRDMLDFYAIQFDDPGANPIDTPGKFQSPRPLKPSISHEAGNYVTFSRPDLVDQFQHDFKPFWLTDGKAMLEKLGLSQEADQWSEKSERLYALLHKYNVEGIRKNPLLSGYHWWLFQDYWTSSNGLVDHYFRPKSIAATEVLKFNNDVVLLQDGLQHTYRAQERLALKLLVSNFSPAPLQGSFNWKLEMEGRSVAQEEKSLANPAPQGELTEMGNIDVALPDTELPKKMKITLELTASGRQIVNDWTTWLYPSVIQPASASAPVFAEEIYSKQFPNWNLQPIPLKGELAEHAVYLTSWPCDPRITDALKRGADVVMLDGTELLMESNPITFKTSWWRADGSNINHTGTFVYDHPVTRAMAPDGWCDDGWFHLIEGSKRFNLETAPARPEIIIRALPGMMAIKDCALLFAVGVEKGTVYASGLNHIRAKGRPENEWIIARLIEQAAQFQPTKANWPASFFSVVSIAPEGCIPGFRKLVSNEGEEGSWYSFKADHARILLCRQNKPGNRVTWETAPVPEGTAGDRVTFVFAGGLGFGSEPKTEGFVLEINGKDALRFDYPEPKTWQSDDKRVELRFDVSRSVSVDQFGLFHLTVPRELLKPGEPNVLGVRSLGTGSQRWFGLNPYF